MSRPPLLFIDSESVQAFFMRIFPVNSPDLLSEKWTIMHEISSKALNSHCAFFALRPLHLY